jgi:hypothetical protein
MEHAEVPDFEALLEKHGIRRAPPTGPLRSRDLVACRLGGVLLAGRCAERQVRTWPSGRRKGRPIWLACHGCETGAGYLARLADFVRPRDSQPAEVMSLAQRRAKILWRLSNLEHPEHELGLSPLEECNMLTPDDRGTDADAG